ncbi:MAG: hypothetical protein ABW123_07250 [Cystobacter sp.]
MGCVLGGCLIPQEERYLQTLPTARNNPPRIVENLVTPAFRIIRAHGAAPPCALEFSVFVEDPDVDDTILVRWYVDYDPAQPGPPDWEETLLPDGKVRRDKSVRIQAIFNSAQFSRLNTPGDHTVEVLVADRALLGREPQPDTYVLPDGEILRDPGYSVTYAWFVNTVSGGQCP